MRLVQSRVGFESCLGQARPGLGLGLDTNKAVKSTKLDYFEPYPSIGFRARLLQHRVFNPIDTRGVGITLCKSFTTTMEGLERRQLQGSHEACGQTTLRTLEMKNKEGCSGNDCLRRYMLSLPSITCQGHHAPKVYPFTLPVMFSVHCFGCSLSTLEYMSAIAS